MVRLILGDINAVDLVPPVSGQGNYAWFSDAEISAFVTQSEGNYLRAVGFAILQLATGAAQKGINVKTDDLSVDASVRGTSLTAIAMDYFAEANRLDTIDDQNVFTIVVPTDPSPTSMWDFPFGFFPALGQIGF